MTNIVKKLFLNEEKSGVAYFLILICVLLTIWGFLVTNAIQIQQESAQTHYTKEK